MFLDTRIARPSIQVAGILPGVFTGFPPDAVAFYERLAADNTKTFWDANRETYERAVREPMEDLVAELTDEFGAAKVFRPYRDVRFSKDKTPYKFACAALLRPNEGTNGGHYVELSAQGLRTGVGVWHLERDELERARRAIDGPGGARLGRIAEELPLHGPELKTAPRGYPKDHPRIELLRRKRFVVMWLHEPGPWLSTAEARERVAADWRRARPLTEWLEEHVWLGGRA